MARRIQLIGTQDKPIVLRNRGLYYKCRPGDRFIFRYVHFVDANRQAEAHQLQFNGLGGSAGDQPAACHIEVEIDHCQFLSTTGQTEDLLSFISVQGTIQKPLRVHDCFFRGPTTQAGTHWIADRAVEHLLAYNNRSEGSSNWAAAIAGGSHNRFFRNTVATARGGGIYCYNMYKRDSFEDNRVDVKGKFANVIQAPQPTWFGD